jgi:hypothetical protein
MTRKNSPIPMFVVIYPYKFNDFLYDLMEIEYFKPYCEVAIWDISIPRSSKKEFVLVESMRQFFLLLMDLRKAAKRRKVCVLNEVTMENVSSIICNFMVKVLIKKTGAAILDVYNGGVQIFAVEAMSGGRRNRFLRKLLVYIKRTNSFPETFKMLKGFFCQALVRVFDLSPTTHRLAAGDEWIEVAKRHGAEKKGIKLVYGSSNDFSNNLLGNADNNDVASGNRKSAILLDGAGPAFGGDHIHVRRRPILTSDVWYPSLTRFLDKVEAETGVVVEIAGHYKSSHPPIAPCFGNRRVYYGATKELVKNSEFVITRMSAAVSYAVIFRKPVMYIYSNQLKNDLMAMNNIKMMAAALGDTPVNIDDPTINISALLTVNEEKYSAYEKACLTSVKILRPNVQIILEDVMGIITNPNSFRKGASNANLQ